MRRQLRPHFKNIGDCVHCVLPRSFFIGRTLKTYGVINATHEAGCFPAHDATKQSAQTWLPVATR